MFTGFSDATIDFLWELRFHNERPWFLEHKQVFLDTLDRPMKALAADVTAALEQAYPDRKWYLHVARIYRDARRLHGNGTYKENLWFTLRCDSSRGPEIPAFYFEITPHNYSYGMGFYWAKANTMACFRRAIDADPLPLTALAERHPRTWFRVMYLQPEGATDELLSVMAARENVCSYLDIPLQHVSEPILRAMNRRGDAAAFRALIERIEAAVPDITLRTTLIAGFPGETDEQFEELLNFVSEGLFHYVGVFPYSREEGTAAFDLPNQIDEDEKAERAQVLRDAADAACGPRIAERIGKGAIVLVEGTEEDGQRFGRAQCQAPEVDGVTYVSRGEIGAFVSCTIADTLLYEMEGE